MSCLDLINMKWKWHKKLLVIFGLFLIMTLFLLSRDVSDIYNTYGYVVNSNIVFNLDLEHTDILNKKNYIKVNGDVCDLEVLDIGDIQVDRDNLINYQEIVLDGYQSDYENQVVKLTIYYNKEKVWKKLKKVIWR